MKKVDYIDDAGIHRRVHLPDESNSLEEGIPLGLRVDELFEDASSAFRQRLMQELHERGLVEPGDFLLPGSPEMVRAALLAAIKRDTLDIITFAKEESRNGETARR